MLAHQAYMRKRFEDWPRTSASKIGDILLEERARDSDESDTDSTSTDSSESIKEKPGDDFPIDAPANDIEESSEDQDVDDISSPVSDDSLISERESNSEREKRALEHRYYDDPLGSDAMWAPEAASKVGDILLDDNEKSSNGSPRELDERPYGHPHITANAPPEDTRLPPKPEPVPPSTDSSDDDESVVPELSSEVTIALKDKTSDETEESLEDETKKKIV